MMLNVLKRIFKDALRTDQMIKGDAIQQKSSAEQDKIIIRLVQDMIEILANFQLVTINFGEIIMEQVANTNFLVNLTNAYSLLRKIKAMWKCSLRDSLESCCDTAIKLTIQITAEVLQKGIVAKVGIFTKNNAINQNKLAQTIKSYILSVTGNQDLSKEILHKQINFMCQESESEGLYSGKNYALNLLRHVMKLGVDLRNAIEIMEDRYLSDQDKDFLLMIIDSMRKGQKVQVKKIK